MNQAAVPAVLESALAKSKPPETPPPDAVAMAIIEPLDIVDELCDSYLTYAQSSRT